MQLVLPHSPAAMNLGLSLIPFLLLPFSSLLPSVASSHYGVFPGRTGNHYTLRCRIDDSFLEPQDGIEWLFNGSDYTYHTSCFAGAVATANTITFNHTSDCDGYIQCGNDTEYSLPVLLQGKKIITVLKFLNLHLFCSWSRTLSFLSTGADKYCEAPGIISHVSLQCQSVCCRRAQCEMGKKCRDSWQRSTYVTEWRLFHHFDRLGTHLHINM